MRALGSLVTLWTVAYGLRPARPARHSCDRERRVLDAATESAARPSFPVPDLVRRAGADAAYGRSDC